MKKKTEDEEIIDQLSEKIGREAHERFLSDRTRNLSVHVLDRLEEKKRSRRWVRGGLGVALTAATAVLLYIVVPQPTQPVSTTTPSNEIHSILIQDEGVLAEEYVEDIIDNASLDIIAEASYADPLILEDDDIDALLEGI